MRSERDDQIVRNAPWSGGSDLWLEPIERDATAEARDEDLDDGATAVEDSGAGSFLDRFVPPLAPRSR